MLTAEFFHLRVSFHLNPTTLILVTKHRQCKLLQVRNAIIAQSLCSYSRASTCDLDTLPPPAQAWLLPDEFKHLELHTAARYDHEALPYQKWVASVRRSMPLTPDCLEGPVEELPSRLQTAFEKACAQPSAPRPERYIAEKTNVLGGLGLQILNLGLWAPSAPPVPRFFVGMEPINSANIEHVHASRLSLRHGLEALDCVSFITSIFFTVGYIQTPPSPTESPVSWVPYTILPSDLPPKLDRTLAPDLAHRAMRFRQHQALFNFEPSVSAADAKPSDSPVNYWTSCAGLGGRGITSHLSSLVLKILRCHGLYQEQVWIFCVTLVAHFS